MNLEIILWLTILLPVISSIICLFMPSPRMALGFMCIGVFTASLIGLCAVWSVLLQGKILFAAAGWLFMDALSAYNLFVMLIVFCLSTVYSCIYFKEEHAVHSMTLKQIRQFTALWLGAQAAMTVVLLSNNLGIMWVGMETTTLITAFLICVRMSRESLEAMWKYIMICSVGVAFAFMGTLLVAASTKEVGLGSSNALLWTTLRANAGDLNPALVKAAFIFLLVGYGTKAGLAPMHSWLPDAHSEAPSPVSALFSGFLLSSAMYCLMRYIPIVEGATQNAGWSLNLLTGFGLLSITMAAAFILFQNNLKRFLAYSSMEHLGIIALGLGLGGIGTFAALFHTLNHSLCKPLSFFSAGRLGQIFRSYDLGKMKGVLKISPVWGTGIFIGILALLGIAPFSLFMSEYLIIKAAIDTSSILILVVFILGIGIVFVGALGLVIPLVWGKTDKSVAPVRAGFLEIFLVLTPLAVLLLLGLWMPETLATALNSAADIIHNTGNTTVASGVGQ